MKREMITVKTPEGLVLKVPAHVVATTFVAAALAHVGLPQIPAVPAANETTSSDRATPALGEYWPGEGGHNGAGMSLRDALTTPRQQPKPGRRHPWNRSKQEHALSN